jgi:hypothetical protein
MKEIRKEEQAEKKYYYIPVATKFVEYEGETLLDILANLDDEIATREEEYLSFYGEPVWGTEGFEKFMNKYKKETQKKYNERGIIEKIGVVYNDGEYKELKTQVPLTVSSDTWINLSQHEIAKEEVETLINNNKNYNTQVKSFFKSYEEKKASSKVKVKGL